ncbi:MULTISPECIES: MerR family transcriptional regulator [Gordonibacter]|uniref:MerR family transcriptional regulator n=1 Tax=Gordonibacter faecis TaxID=3047475 RepID=A0ABT7DIX2_9ACTN|nr:MULTISPECIES: MerR family transcriptional regulator [unclassified Gordonibacter]MDJ1649327.1 MerR family transcriptional regulator [Gordonibacter sp. KGMB12511]
MQQDNQSEAAAALYPSTVPCLGIAEVSDRTGISAFTIRYYDKCGFFPNLARDQRGVRTFSQADVAQLQFVDALRKSGLSIEGIQYYVKLQRRGQRTRAERLEILRAQETVLEYQRAELDESLRRLHAATMDLESEEVAEAREMV